MGLKGKSLGGTLVLLAFVFLVCDVRPANGQNLINCLLSTLLNIINDLLSYPGFKPQQPGVVGWNAQNQNPCCYGWTGFECDSNNMPIKLNLSNQLMYGPIPPSLLQLTTLTEWDFSNNNLSQSLPSSLGSQTSLVKINVSNNQLTGSIPSLSGLTNLVTLDLSNNALTGAVPSLTGLTNLVTVDLSNNKLSGSLPSLSGLTKLVSLNLSNNNFGSSLTIPSLPALQVLKASSAGLTGQIPQSLSTLTNLQTLLLDGNSLTGTIPSNISKLTNLLELHLGSNQLVGSIPEELGQLTNLTKLVLSNNQLTGLIPTTLATLEKLKTLDLSYNLLTGLIPDIFDTLEALTSLVLQNNLLCGLLPPALSDATSLLFNGQCNCFFLPSGCSGTNCANQVSGLCSPDHCTNVTCPISLDNLLWSLFIPLDTPTFHWQFSEIHNNVNSTYNVSLHVDLNFLVELNNGAPVGYTMQTLPGAGLYTVTQTMQDEGGVLVNFYSFQTTLANGALVTFTYMIANESFTLQFTDTVSIQVPANTVEFQTTIENWPFAPGSNGLRLGISVVLDPPPANRSESVPGNGQVGSSVFNLTTLGHEARLSMSFLNIARTSQTQLDSTGSVSVSLAPTNDFLFVDLPSSAYLNYDPNFAVLLGPSTDGDGEATNAETSNSASETLLIAVAVAVPSAFIGVVLVIAGILAFSAYTYWKWKTQSRLYKRGSVHFGDNVLQELEEDATL
jgi:Leucine-rich repeat (LRR) protein